VSQIQLAKNAWQKDEEQEKGVKVAIVGRKGVTVIGEAHLQFWSAAFQCHFSGSQCAANCVFRVCDRLASELNPGTSFGLIVHCVVSEGQGAEKAAMNRRTPKFAFIAPRATLHPPRIRHSLVRCLPHG
jgi:hypothetical protein